MADIKFNSIPFSDFQNGDLIDPEQVDQNNKKIVDKQNELVTQSNGVKQEIERHKTSGDHDARYVTKSEGAVFNQLLAQHKNADDHDERYALNSKVDILEKEVRNVALGSTSAEVAQTRVGADGTSYDTLKERVDAEYSRVVEQLAKTELKVNNIVFSKAIADGVTDNAVLLQNEINALNYGDHFVTPKGIIRINSSVSTSTKEGVTLDFSSSKFLMGNTSLGFNLRLKNSVVNGLKIDGDRDNKTFNEANFGTVYLFKVDTGSENVVYNNTYLLNSPFCGGMLGENLNNIVFNTLFAENLGEHVFYKTGVNVGNVTNSNIVFNNVFLKNIGVNAHNISSGHFSQFYKSFNGTSQVDTGICDNITINNINLKQIPSVSSYVGITIFGIYELKNAVITNASGDFAGVLNGRYLDNIKVINSTISRPFYTNDNVSGYNNIVFENCRFTDFCPHINLGTKYIGCVFDKYFRSSNTTGLLNKKLVFDRCTINSTSYSTLDHILTDVDILNCEINSFISSQLTTPMIDFGGEVVVAGKKIRIDNIQNNANLFNFLFTFRNPLSNVFVSNIVSTGRITTSETINRLELTNILYDFPSNYYTPILTDTNATSLVKFNTKSVNGNSYDNYPITLA